jgi:hypothetical protein
MNKRWLVFVILAALALSSLGAASQDTAQSKLRQDSPVSPSGTIRGYVFRDSNRNGVFDEGEEGLPGVYVTIKYGDYEHTYYTGNGDPEGDNGSYGPRPLPGGYWTVTLHVPDGYRSTSPSELTVYVPDGGAATGANFGIYGSGEIRYSAGSGVGMGGGAGSGLPQTGSQKQAPRGHLIALVAALMGFLVLFGTPWCIAKTKRS